MSLFPVLPTMKKSAKKVSNVSLGTQIPDWLFDFFKSESAKYEFSIQSGSLSSTTQQTM